MSITSNFPAIKPTLLLDFANTEELDGRVTFTRASTATYYGTQTAKAEENLLLQSQTFDNASWVKTTATVTADSFAAPDGTTTAETLTATSTNSTLLQTFTATATAYTFSVYIYRKTGTGNVDITVDGTTYATQTITGAWARYSITTTPSAGSKTAGIRLATSGDEVYIWGAQLEQRSAVTAYTPTTTAPITNYIPQLLTAASGVARFDNNPTTFESLGLEIEESRTNLVTYSAQFDDASWTKANSTITANTIVAPDGSLIGDKLTADATSNFHTVFRAFSFTSGTAYTVSIFAKAGEYQYLSLTAGNTGTFPARVTFDLISGTVSSTVSGTGSIQSVGNGWYRCSVSATAAATASTGVNFAVSSTGSYVTYTGDGYSGIYIWGAQLEAGAFATSYIPTVASQVTRAADAATMTGTNFSSWYNQAEGTFFAQFVPASSSFGSNKNLFLSSDGTANNYAGLRYTGSGTDPTFSAVVSGTAQAAITTGAMVAGTSYKMAGAYEANDFAVSRNAGTVGTDTSGTVPVVTQAEIGMLAGTSVGTQTISKLAYYPLRVTNAQLQGLTS